MFIKITRLIFFSSLAFALILCTGIFIFFQTFDTEQYLSPITQKISLVLNRPVSVGHLGLGLSSQGIALDAGPLIITDDANFTTQPFIKINRIRLGLDFKSLILKHKIYITQIILQSPQIHFIRSQEGILNVGNIGPAIANIPPVIENINPVIASAAKKSLTKIWPVSNPQTNHSGENSKKQSLPSDVNIKSVIIQDASISFIDQSQVLPLDIWLSNINVNLNEFSLSKPTQVLLEACLYSQSPNIHAQTLMFWDQAKQSIEISGLSFHGDFSQLEMDRLKAISPVILDNSMLSNIKGSLQLNIADLEINSSRGVVATGGDILISGVVIKNFNLIKSLLSHALGAFGGMEGYIDKLKANDTIIQSADAKFAIHDKAVVIGESEIKTNILELTAQGSIDQGLNLDMQTILHLNEDASAALINELDGLKYLMDDSKRITIDASLQGVIPHLKYKPSKDFRKKSRRFFMQEGGNILGMILSGGNDSSEVQQTSPSEPHKKSKKSFKNILSTFLQ